MVAFRYVCLIMYLAVECARTPCPQHVHPHEVQTKELSECQRHECVCDCISEVVTVFGQ